MAVVSVEADVLKGVLKELKRMSPGHQITMLKFIKNLSMLSTTLDSLSNSNAIEVLTDLLHISSKELHSREVSNQVLNTIYNLCRLDKARQEEAAMNGIIPVLQRIIKTKGPLKEFALPILCDMAHSGKVGRRELWRNKGLAFYISLLADEYWQVTALDAIFIWYGVGTGQLSRDLVLIHFRLQEETAKVEEHLLDGSFTIGIIKCFTTSKANAFENLLEPLQKLLRLSPPVALCLAHPDLFHRILRKLSSNKAVVRLNLLRIVRSICDASDQQGALISRYGLEDIVQRLSENDGAVLVRNMASELIKSSEINEKLGLNATRLRPGRRPSSSTTTPPSLFHTYSVPSTPTSNRSSYSTSYAFERDARRGSAIHGSIPHRPVSRDGSGSSALPAMLNGSKVAAKSRLPRTTSVRPARQQVVISPRREENALPSRPIRETTPVPTPNSRRRRRASGDTR